MPSVGVSSASGGFLDNRLASFSFPIDVTVCSCAGSTTGSGVENFALTSLLALTGVDTLAVAANDAGRFGVEYLRLPGKCKYNVTTAIQTRVYTIIASITAIYYIVIMIMVVY